MSMLETDCTRLFSYAFPPHYLLGLGCGPFSACFGVLFILQDPGEILSLPFGKGMVSSQHLLGFSSLALAKLHIGFQNKDLKLCLWPGMFFHSVPLHLVEKQKRNKTNKKPPSAFSSQLTPDFIQGSFPDLLNWMSFLTPPHPIPLPLPSPPSPTTP